MEKLTAKETLLYLIDMLSLSLDELQREKRSDVDPFLYGEKTAYAECLELIQFWEGAQAHGLDYKIEKKYPLFI